ncbi:MAG: putative Rae1, nuclear pore complex component, partial [Streblomastix strix]
SGWDKMINFWDGKTANKPVLSITSSERVYAMDCIDNQVAFGSADQQVIVYDVRNTNQQLANCTGKDNKSQITMLKLFPSKDGLAYSCIEGRIFAQFFPIPGKKQPDNFSFRVHRDTTKKLIYSANCISFHPQNGVLCSGGGDGIYSIWDLRKGDKCGQDVKYNLPITACAFSPDGKFLAHAIGYDWSRV